MRGDDRHPDAMFSYVAPEQRVPADHPLRAIRAMVDTALRELSPEFERLYPKTGRPSIPPEKLLRALLLQMLYSVRSERQLMEQLDYNLLFRWFVGLSMDDPVWDPTVFTKNRERLLRGDIARAFFERVLAQAQGRQLLSGEHFTVDGTLIEAWAGLKSFKKKGEPAPAARRSGQPDGELPRRAALERHPRLHDRSGGPAEPQESGARSQAGLPGARADGEPPRAGRRHLRESGHGDRRTGDGARDGHQPAARGHRGRATRAMTPAASSRRSARSASRRMSPRTPRVAPVRSMTGPPAMRGTR